MKFAFDTNNLIDDAGVTANSRRILASRIATQLPAVSLERGVPMLNGIQRRISDLACHVMLPSAAKRVKADNLTYLANRKLLSLHREMSRIGKGNVPGDFLEFGVALGGSAILMAKSCAGARSFHGFDVFGMIPPPTHGKDDGKSKARYQEISSGRSVGLGGETYYGYRSNLYDEVRSSFLRYGLPVGQQVHLHKGLFAESWPDVAPQIGQVSLTHIDCDWYEPVKFCLEAVAPLTAPQGAIILDDYSDYGGCRTATDEFLDAHLDFRISRQSGHLVLHKV
jgi:O-methyltransferase